MITRLAPSRRSEALLPATSSTNVTAPPTASFPQQLASKAAPRKPPLNTPPPVASPLKKLAGDLDQQRGAIDRLLAQASAGRTFSPAELLAMQARVYAYSQTIEVISSLVDKTLSAVKTTLNTQV